MLICMPFGPHTSPSIALSLLKAQLRGTGLRTRVRYFSIDFAGLVGERRYSRIATDSGSPAIRELAGEWLFRDALFGVERDPESYVESVFRRRAAWPKAARKRPLPKKVIADVLGIRPRIDGFLDRCVDEIEREKPAIVGFTSVFQQQIASLALARRIKERLPSTFIVFGGANCEGVMGAETLRQFPFVDAAVSGEGDLVFAELVRRVTSSQPLDDMPGVRTRGNVAAAFRDNTFSNAPSVMSMDELPYPDYDDFFEQFAASRMSRSCQPGLYFETSRGCWWGERNHCTFCGLNGSTMQYRSKSSARALTELTDLATTYPDCDVQVTDNILDMGYFKDFLPALAEAKLPVELFYETKSNLSKAHIRGLRDAGIRKIQPGIESLSDPILKLMRKGVSALQNVQLLKWCKELGVHPYWNLLWGFPGEPAEEYMRMAKLVPYLEHLPPPVGISGLRLDRFSPNFVTAEQLGFANVRPLVPYLHIYPFDVSVVGNLAYYFDFDYREPCDVGNYVAPLLKAVQAWQRVDDSSELLAIETGGDLAIWNLRDAGVEPLTLLTGLQRSLYLACDSARELKSLLQVGEEAGVAAESADAIEEMLGPLVESGLMIRDRSRYLALAIRVGDYQPSRKTMARIATMSRELGKKSGSSSRRSLAAQQDPMNQAVIPRYLLAGKNEAGMQNSTK